MKANELRDMTAVELDKKLRAIMFPGHNEIEESSKEEKE